MELNGYTDKSPVISQYTNLVKWLTVKMKSNPVVVKLNDEMVTALKTVKKTNPQ